MFECRVLFFPRRVTADDRELEHAARALDVLWQCLPPDQILYPDSDTTGLTFETSLELSGLLPCILVNLGSAMTIVKVSSLVLPVSHCVKAVYYLVTVADNCSRRNDVIIVQSRSLIVHVF